MPQTEYVIFCYACEEEYLCLEEGEAAPARCPECGSPTVDIVGKRELED